ncbi:MAG: RNA polymerase sigma factor [Bacteroidales bacterium]|nr:RNA polymerase sigma factor [Bacteroidales bacterium]
MQQVKDGNLREMAELFERYHVKLYNFFLKLTGDRNISQDLTQNLFYRLIKYRHTFREGYSFKSWIYQMARNIHIDYCKQYRKQAGNFKLVEEHDEHIPEPEEIFTEDDFGKLDKALLQLGDEQREIIILSRFQGLKYEEISKINNMSVAAIKVQVHRAIKQLKSLYFKHA